jgi:DNA-binding NarL/FixJ family response regulator
MNKDNSGKIKILITDDHAVFRTGVKTSLSQYADIEVIGEAENGLQLIKLVKFLQPDVILLDIQMPIMDGITTLPEVKKILPNAKVIMLTMIDDISMISKLMEIGANSYLIKNSDSETIYEAIKTVHTKEFFFNDYTNKAMLSGLGICTAIAIRRATSYTAGNYTLILYNFPIVTYCAVIQNIFSAFICSCQNQLAKP